jgi:hypothetical protein
MMQYYSILSLLLIIKMSSYNNYFLTNNDWSVKDVFQQLERDFPSKRTREILNKVKIQLAEASKAQDTAAAETASQLLTNWKVNKFILYRKRTIC